MTGSQIMEQQLGMRPDFKGERLLNCGNLT